jgi:predicted CoA-binding protein
MSGLIDHDSGLIDDDAGLARILTEVRTIALLGASPKPDRPSHGVMRFLLSKGYRVFPVNPGEADGEILGQTVYPDLASVPEPVDMVDVFRASEALPGIVRNVLALPVRPAVLWTQLGVRDASAAQMAAEAGIDVVMDRCPAIEHPRLIGR